MAKKRQSSSTKKTVAAKKTDSSTKKARSKRPAKTASREKESDLAQLPLTAEVVPGFPIVGLGASAGGLEALEMLFKAMPDNAGIGYVVVVHLDPTHISILPELLQKHTKMPVGQIVDGMPVERDHVYVIPPNKDLTILHGTLHLMDLVQPRGVKLPIDSFFRALAQDQKRNAVCIILSGTGTDGTLGVKAIKGEVGMVMVQDEESAKYAGMPRSAIATGLVDYVLPPGKMPEQLIKYTRYATLKATPIAPAEGPIPHALQKIFVILRARTDHDFSLYKKNTICRRIERRMNVHQIDDIADYVRYMQESDREADILFKELLIGVTNFFRDPEAFEILQAQALQKLLAEKPIDYSVRVWVPGCSSGEEAYSVAIMLHECMEKLGRHFHVQIFGTDIDEDAIAMARAGLYPESIMADVGLDRIRRYFIKEENGQYRVKKLIRELLVFAPQNVIKDPPFTKLDLLCCRNLLIYLGTELQRRLLPLFHYSLKPEGILFLGSSESTGQTKDLFDPVHMKWKIFRRIPSSATDHPLLSFPVQPEAYQARDLQLPGNVQRAEELSALQLVKTVLSQSGTPPCAIISDDGNAVYIHGRTGRFLEPAEGKASVNIVEMARPGLKNKLAAAIRQVATHRHEVISKGLHVAYNGDKLYVNLTVKPILEQTAMRGLMMVVFEETLTPTKQETDETKPVPAKRSDKSIEELDQELQYTKENLQTTIEELETSNEELKSTNEELQSTNEELQSTNEELETSKEELQSLNEESATVNEELQARIDELSQTNDDMKNLLDSTAIATIFLDTDLRIRLFTPRATEIIPLTVADAGRPIKHLASTLIDLDLAEYGQRVLKDLAVLEAEVRGKDGRSHVMRVRPYRTVANVIDGVVITFEDVTERKRAEEALRESEGTLRTALALANTSSWELDSINNGHTWSDELYRLLQVDPNKTKPSFDAYVENLHPEDREMVLETYNNFVETKDPYDIVHRLLSRDGTIKYVRAKCKMLYDDDGKQIKAIGMAQDITEFKQVEQALRESKERYRTEFKQVEQALRESKEHYRILFDLVDDPIMLVDPETATFTEFNRHAHEQLGYTREEFTHLTLPDIEAVESERDTAKQIEKIFAHGSEVFETKHKTKDGEIHDVQVTVDVIPIGAKKFLLSTWHDLTPVDGQPSQ